MEQIGVQAVVAGLSGFLGDMGKMDKSIRDLIPGNTLLEKAFLSVGDTIKGFASSAVRTLEYAFGQLLADAIRGVIELLKNMVVGIMDSADDFGKLQIRLERLNFNDAKRSGKEYNEAMEESIRLTQEQINWTLKLGLATPFSPADIANIYTLARGYGFSAEEAKTLTESVIEFTSGMGLSNTELERIVINFGQLSQQGKLNGQDIRDLARGAYVPVNRVLDATAEKLGMTREEFNKARLAGKIGAEGVEAFRQAFVDLVGVDFTGASEQLGTIFSVAVENVKEFLENSIGLKIVLPVLTLIGTKINAITQELANNKGLWAKVSGALEIVGGVIMRIVEDLMGFLPSTESLADSIANAFNNISLWFLAHEDDITSWVKDAVAWLKDTLIPTLVNVWQWLFGNKEEGEQGAIAGFFDFVKNIAPGVIALVQWIVDKVTAFSNWVTENKPLIDEFFSTLGQIVSDVIERLFGKTPGEGEGFLGILKNIMQWVIDNQSGITDFVEGFVKLVAVFELLTFVGGVVLGVFGAIFGLIAGLGAAIVGLAAWIALEFSKFMTGIIDDMVAWADESNAKFEEWRENLRISIRNWVVNAKRDIGEWADNTLSAIKQWATNTWNSIVEWGERVRTSLRSAGTNFSTAISTWINETQTKITEWANGILTSVKSRLTEWVQAGRDMINGLIQGIVESGTNLIDTVVQLALDAYNALTAALGIQSPSKLFMEVGYKIDEGLAAGILGMAKDVGNAMGTVMGQVTAPAFATASAPSRSISNNQQYTQNYNLNISSNANQENLAADFEMLQSLAG